LSVDEILLIFQWILSPYLVQSDTHIQYVKINILISFYTILSPYIVWHTQSLHGNKYYYYNLHNFITTSCPVWHSQYMKINILITIYTILSSYLVQSDTHSQYTKINNITAIHTIISLFYTLVFFTHFQFFYLERIPQFCPCKSQVVSFVIHSKWMH
jgi:hypothetical protein